MKLQLRIVAELRHHRDDVLRRNLDRQLLEGDRLRQHVRAEHLGDARGDRLEAARQRRELVHP